MDEEEIYKGNSLTMPCAEIIYNSMRDGIDKIKHELEEPDLTDEEKKQIERKVD